MKNEKAEKELELFSKANRQLFAIRTDLRNNLSPEAKQVRRNHALVIIIILAVGVALGLAIGIAIAPQIIHTVQCQGSYNFVNQTVKLMCGR